MVAILLTVGTVGTVGLGVDIEAAQRSVPVVRQGGSVGAGFVVGDDLVLTAAHVVSDGTVTLDFEAQSIDGTVISSNVGDDLTLIELSEPAPTAALTLRTDPVRVGDQVWAVGSSSVTRGIVSAALERGGLHVVQTDAAVNPGNSGGPLIDADGQVAGIVTSKARGAEGVAYAVAADELRRFLDAEPTVDATSAGQNTTRVWIPLAAFAALLAVVAITYTRRRNDSSSGELDIHLGPVQVHEPPSGGTVG